MLSTVPGKPATSPRAALFVRATADVVFVAFRDTVAAAAPRPAVAAGNCSMLHIWANVGQVGRRLRRDSRRRGHARAGEEASGRRDLHRPQSGRRRPGLSARIDVDTRFITSPTKLKLAAMVLGVVSVLASIVALVSWTEGLRGGCLAPGAGSSAPASSSGSPTSG